MGEIFHLEGFKMRPSAFTLKGKRFSTLTPLSEVGCGDCKAPIALNSTSIAVIRHTDLLPYRNMCLKLFGVEPGDITGETVVAFGMETEEVATMAVKVKFLRNPHAVITTLTGIQRPVGI